MAAICQHLRKPEAQNTTNYLNQLSSLKILHFLLYILLLLFAKCVYIIGFQNNFRVETLRLEQSGIDYVGANYIGEMLKTNVYIKSLVCVYLFQGRFYVGAGGTCPQIHLLSPLPRFKS